MAKTDEHGRKSMSMEDGRFEMMLQKEKDHFYLETGYYTEQVSGFLREHKAKAEFEAQVKAQKEAAGKKTN